MIWWIVGIAAALFAAVFALGFVAQAVAALFGVNGPIRDGESDEAWVCLCGFIVSFCLAAGCLSMAALQTVQGLMGAR